MGLLAGDVPEARLAGPRSPRERRWPIWVGIRLELAPEAMARLRNEPRAWVPVRVGFNEAPAMPGRLRIKGTRGSLRSMDDGPSFTVVLESSVSVLDGAARFHIENGAEDPMSVRGAWAAHVVGQAGIPCPRQSWASVRLNGRPVGLRGLKEGFDSGFARHAWPGEAVVMAEPRDGADVGDALDVKEDGPPETQDRVDARARMTRAWRSLADAVAQGGWDAARPWLDETRFLRFAALEVLLGHRDGYGLARNNYRVAFVRGRFEWVPWGLDTLLESPSLPTWPSMAGTMSRALMASERMRPAWQAALRQWGDVALDGEALDAWARANNEVLRRHARGSDLGAWRSGVEELRRSLQARRDFVASELAMGVPADAVGPGGTWRPTGWRVQGVPPDGAAGERHEHDRSLLEITAGQRTSSAWVASVRLAPGAYRFSGTARVDGFRSLAGARRDGVVLRVANTAFRSPSLQEDGDWKELLAEFRVGEPGSVVSLMCEFRASAGRARFDRASLLLERLE